MSYKFLFLVLAALGCLISPVFAGVQSFNDSKVLAGFKFRPPRGGHNKNVRPSTKGKHEKADARRQREQEKAREKREQSRRN